MIPAAWIARYLAKSGDTAIGQTEYSHGCEHGFATWEIADGKIVVVQCFSPDNGLFWLEFFRDMGKKLNMNIRFATRRNPKTWERRYGAKIVGHIMEIAHG